MQRYLLALFGVAALVACGDLGGINGFGALGLSPVLDSIFVGDRLVARQVTYIDANGNPAPAGPVKWASTDTTVAQIDTLSGAISGRKRGIAVITARAQGLTAGALVAVSNTLDISLLIDTVYMMPNDTLTLPIVVRKAATPPPATVWFTAPSNPAFTVDSVRGVVKALAVGGPFPYIVHADSLADTGTVTVMTLSDTAASGGRVFFSVSGTANAHVGGTAQAMNYGTSTGKQAFRLTGTHFVNGLQQQIKINGPDSVIDAPKAVAIDSLSISQDTNVVVCTTPSSWAVWDFQKGTISALSRRGGTLSITGIATVPNGLAISGHFTFMGQRADRYTDPLAAVAVTGSFVAPLIANTTRCR